MPVLYLDIFSTTTTAAVAAEDTTITLPHAAVIRIKEAMGWPDPGYIYLAAAELVTRVPLWLDDGSVRELVEAWYVDDTTDTVMVRRAATPHAFGASTVVRSAPTAEFAAAAHEAGRTAETTDVVIARPGEVAQWVPTGTAIEIRLPVGGSWSRDVQAFVGECWPARIELASLATERTVSFTTFDGAYPVNINLPDSMGSVSSVVVPNTATMAVFDIRKSSVAMRAADGAVPVWLVRMELFG